MSTQNLKSLADLIALVPTEPPIAPPIVVETPKALRFNELEALFTRAGDAAGEVEKSGEELGLALFRSARAGFIDTSSVRTLYIRQREAQAARAGAKLDLADEKTAKSITGNASKLNVFVHVATAHEVQAIKKDEDGVVKEHKVKCYRVVNADPFLTDAQAAARLVATPKTSIYNALLTIMRAQKDEKHQLSRDAMVALFAAKAKEEKTEAEKLEAILEAIGKVYEKHGGDDVLALHRACQTCILTRTVAQGQEALSRLRADATPPLIADPPAPVATQGETQIEMVH